MKKIWVALLMFVLCASALADTRYITGPQAAMLRTGPSEYADLSGKLAKDTQVDVVGIDRTTDYALVVTQDKKRGWLPASSLTTTAPATPVLVQPAAADSPSPTIPNNETPAEVSHTSSQPTTTDKNAAAVIADTAPTPAATAALDPSKSHYTDVKEKLNALASANAATPNTIVKLTPQEMINYTAIQRENRAWFISGAGILILGMFVGLIVSKIAFRRRRSSWD